jgi:Tetratricopeptide repeat
VLFRAGRSLGEAGLVIAAIAHFERLAVAATTKLGPDHPDTLTTRSNVAFWRGEAGDAAGAAVAFEALLTDQLRVLGPDHPDTLRTRSNLDHWRGMARSAVGQDPAAVPVGFDPALANPTSPARRRQWPWSRKH